MLSLSIFTSNYCFKSYELLLVVPRTSPRTSKFTSGISRSSNKQNRNSSIRNLNMKTFTNLDHNDE